MCFQTVLLCGLLSSVVLGCTAQIGSDYEVFYEWKQIDYNFPNNSVRQQLIDNGGFIQKNVLPTAVKIFRDTMFLATPRYLPGVPYSLSMIPYKKSFFDIIFRRNAGPKLTPFPSYEMQQEGNCSAFQLIQAMELDPYNRLWVVDAGRTEVLANAKNLCPAKIVVIDLMNKNRIERSYEFPATVVPRDSNAIKDIQIACTSRENCFTYISNINVTCSLIVYDYKNNDSWYAVHPTMQPDPEKAAITIEGTTAQAPFGITGLGLTPKSTNYSRVYFSKVAGDRIYSIPTCVLQNSTVLKANPVLNDSDVTDLGQKSTGQTDGTAMDNKGRWFYGSLPESAVYNIDTSSNPTTLPKATRSIRNTKDLQWPDTFSFDNAGYLAFTSVRFQLFANQKINPNEVNYRIIRFKTNSKAYNQ